MNIEQFLTTLPMMAKGLFGIFLVTVIIVAAIWLMNRFTGGKGDK